MKPKGISTPFALGSSVGVLSFAMMLLDYFSIHRFEIPLSPIETKLFVLLLVVAIPFLIGSLDSQARAGSTLFRRFLPGFLLAAWSGLFWALLSLLYVALDPTYTHEMVVEASRQVSPLAPAAESVAARLVADVFYRPWGQLLSKLLIALIIGGIVSFIASWVFHVRSKKGAK